MRPAAGSPAASRRPHSKMHAGGTHTHTHMAGRQPSNQDLDSPIQSCGCEGVTWHSGLSLTAGAASPLGRVAIASVSVDGMGPVYMVCTDGFLYSIIYNIHFSGRLYFIYKSDIPGIYTRELCSCIAASGRATLKVQEALVSTDGGRID